MTFTGDKINGLRSTGEQFVVYNPETDNSALIGTLQQNGITFSAAPPERQSFLMQLFISSFPILLLIGVWVYFMRQMQGGGGRPRRHVLRQEPRAAAGRGPGQGHLRGRRRRRRGQGGSRRDRRLPEGPGQVPEARRQDPARRADGRLARHRQDAARPGHRRRGQGAVLHDLGLGLRRDVRRRRRLARARHVRAGQEARALHHLHRRDRRGRAAIAARASAAVTTSASRR